MAIPGILIKIVETKKAEVAESLKNKEAIIAQAKSLPGKNSAFKNALQKDGLSVISEVKKASPSAGIICEDFDHMKIAQAYQEGGADAISCLTDVEYFKGAPEYLQEICKTSTIPVLRKDFIIDPIQIYEAKAWGASAFLLIAAILTTEQIKEFIELGKELGLDALVEIHDAEELKKALEANAEIIGVNNRDLRDFTVDMDLTARLSKDIPNDKILVGESGIKTPEDAHKLFHSGSSAVLIGETLMRHGVEGCAEAIRKIKEV